jgi:hypothetical protein
MARLIVTDSLWFMPRDNLHMTAMEVTHSRTAAEIAQIVSSITVAVQDIVDHTYKHRARLIKPMLGFDSSAIALSFVPAAGENVKDSRTVDDDNFTYSHLRRDLYSQCNNAGAIVQSRYIIETAHLTIARFINEDDFKKSGGELDKSKVSKLLTIIEDINEWLEKEYWPDHSGRIQEGGEWIVGQERGLDCQYGTLWYGYGNRVALGKGF